jgi:SNF2 family DNA or RNA helicase
LVKQAGQGEAVTEFTYIIPPYEWQKKLLTLSTQTPNVAVLADMGTGKTKGVIDCLRYKYAQATRVRRTLIISPLVTLHNWKDEFMKNSKLLPQRVHVLSGSTEKKLKIIQQAIDRGDDGVFITNYESMISPKMIAAVKEWEPEILVLDESHYVKSHKAKRSKAIHDISLGCEFRFIMSGTPMTNSLTDIFMQFLILDNGETFGRNFFTFQRTYMYDQNGSWAHLHTHFPKWVPRPEMLDALQAKIYTKAIRVTKAECLDLPPRIQQVYEVELSPSQRKYYKAMEDDYVTFVEENAEKGISVATTALTKALRLQQIVTGYAKLDDGSEIEIEDNPRLSALEELISALHAQHKVIVWCSFINNYRQIGKLLEALQIKHVFITGEESLAEKKEAMDLFNSDTATRLAVCNRRAAGIGVNLVAAKYSITYSRNFSLSEELQSGDRNYRGGSEIHDSIVKIDLCAKDTIDEAVTKALIDKKEVSDKVIEQSIRERR